jgi:hypothetical protein
MKRTWFVCWKDKGSRGEGRKNRKIEYPISNKEYPRMKEKAFERAGSPVIANVHNY